MYQVNQQGAKVTTMVSVAAINNGECEIGEGEDDGEHGYTDNKCLYLNIT